MNIVLRALASVGFLFFSIPAFSADPIPPDPIYIRIENGWKGYFARNDEFLEYSIVGSEVKLQNPYQIMVKPGLGLMVSFADKKNFGEGGNILEAHRKWELEHWQKQAKKVETKDRSDLAKVVNGSMVTEFSLWGNQPDQYMSMYLVAIPTSDGVYVFSISPTKNTTDEYVKSFLGSIKLTNTRFDLKREHEKLRAEFANKK